MSICSRWMVRFQNLHTGFSLNGQLTKQAHRVRPGWEGKESRAVGAGEQLWFQGISEAWACITLNAKLEPQNARRNAAGPLRRLTGRFVKPLFPQPESRSFATLKMTNAWVETSLLRRSARELKANG